MIHAATQMKQNGVSNLTLKLLPTKAAAAKEAFSSTCSLPSLLLHIIYRFFYGT